MSMGFDVVSYLMGKAAGGGGGDVPLLSRAAWNTLSRSQKMSYGLVAIQDAASGYDRGGLVYGADYDRLLLEYSTQPVLAESWAEAYTGGATWGSFALTKAANIVDGAVRLPTDNAAYYQFSSEDNTSVTVYGVAKQYDSTSGNKTLFGIPYSSTSGKLPNIFENSYQVYSSVYGGDAEITGVKSNDWHVYTIAIDGTGKKAAFYVDGNYIRETSFSSSGQTFVAGAAVSDLTKSLPLDVKYVGVVQGTETSQIIVANHGVIMSYYGIGA